MLEIIRTWKQKLSYLQTAKQLSIDAIVSMEN